MPGKKLKFPEPNDYPAKEPFILCPADRVIGLYNQATDGDAQRIAKKMKAWFTQEAKNKNWADCRFVPEVQSRHGAGCVLLNPPSVEITVNQITIRLADGDADQGA